MKIFVDTTEPGQLFHHLRFRGRASGIEVQRSILHKRDGLAGSARERHPFYGLGADYVITDSDLVPAAAIERKSLDDLAKSIALQDDRTSSARIFRQVRDIMAHPWPILLLEGQPSALYRRVEPLALVIQFWCARQGVSLMYSSSPVASAQAILGITRKLGMELEGSDLRPPPRDDPDEGPFAASAPAHPTPPSRSDSPRRGEAASF